MKLYIILAIIIIGSADIYSQENNKINEEAKYVIFTSDINAEETREGIFRSISNFKTEAFLSSPIHFCVVSKSRKIESSAAFYEYNFEKLAKNRKVTARDSLVILEKPYRFLKSVDVIDLDVIFPKLTKEQFEKFWYNIRGIGPEGNIVYFIDRSEIKNHKIKLYPVKLPGPGY